MRPNERLIETELAERLAVSRTPIRAALQRLAADNLIVRHRQGWVVYEFTKDEIREIYEARSALEGYAMRLAAERATDEQLLGIVAILQESKDILSLSRKHMVEVNVKFHDAIIAASGNRRVAAMVQRNRLYYFNYQVAALYSEEEATTSRTQHEELMRALLDRDPDKAESIAREHIDGALAAILNKMR